MKVLETGLKDNYSCPHCKFYFNEKYWLLEARDGGLACPLCTIVSEEPKEEERFGILLSGDLLKNTKYCAEAHRLTVPAYVLKVLNAHLHDDQP